MVTIKMIAIIRKWSRKIAFSPQNRNFSYKIDNLIKKLYYSRKQ